MTDSYCSIVLLLVEWKQVIDNASLSGFQQLLHLYSVDDLTLYDIRDELYNKSSQADRENWVITDGNSQQTLIVNSKHLYTSHLTNHS